MEKIKNKVNPFSEELINFRQNKVYPVEAINLIEANQEKLIPIFKSWTSALEKIAIEYNLEYKPDLPHRLHFLSLEKIQKNLENNEYSQIIIGIAGPGACGKGSVIEALQLPKVINTTTRNPRSYEIDQVHYHFVDGSTFQKMLQNDDFLSTTNRPDRGWYGIEKKSVDQVLSKSPVVIIEENPETLFQIQKSIRDKYSNSMYFSINYLLPPNPIALHLATRLAKRSLETGENFIDTINSTLGSRQIAEFESLAKTNHEGGNICFFVVNNDVDKISAQIKDIYKVK